jgi:transcriptional regulator with XRE-family HTH domain
MAAGRGRESTIAKRLREARQAAGLSQRELGVLAGFDPSVASPRVNQYERAKHVPNPSVLEKLGRVLNCPLAFFFAVDDGLAVLALAYHRASASERKRFHELASRMPSRRRAD